MSKPRPEKQLAVRLGETEGRKAVERANREEAKVDPAKAPADQKGVK